MARLNQWAFRGTAINAANVLVRDITGAFGLPPLRGDDWVAPGRTGRIFVPKKHDARDIQLEIIVRDVPAGVTPAIFDQIAEWATNRSQGDLTNTLVSGARTGQAECTQWLPKDMGVGGTHFMGIATFHLTDPWLKGPTVTASVTPVAGLAFGTTVANDFGSGTTRTSYALAMTGCVSGQPIIVCHFTQFDTHVLTSITDTFATPHTWTKVDGSAAYGQDCEIYIGTGGAGTSGTITVTAPSAIMAGCATPLAGASTSAGLGAIDVHAHASGSTIPPYPDGALVTPSLDWGGFVIATNAAYPGAIYPVPGTPMAHRFPFLSQINQAIVSTALYPPAGVPRDWWLGGYLTPSWERVDCVVKGSGAAASLNVTNPGSATCEDALITLLGPIINPTVTNLTTGTSFTIARTIAVGLHMYVDCGAFTVVDGAGYNLIGTISHSGDNRFLTFAPGVNVLQVSGGGCTGSSLVTVHLDPPYA